jgi:succinylarginine dihydrolase
MRDEGAANHMRLGASDEQAGINLFVYGDGDPTPESNWPRQSRDACQAIARSHGLPAANTFFLKQHPVAIDSGAFHNDVVAMSHQELLIHHQLAFQETGETIERLETRFGELTGTKLTRIEVPESLLSIDDAVQTYLFNSQILSPISDGPCKPVIICTSQVHNHDAARSLVDQWCQSGIFDRVEFVDLDQSMSGGGGPGCLRLRVPLREEFAKSLPVRSRWSASLDARLRETIEENYVTDLSIEDLSRVEFHAHARVAWERVVQTLAGEPR